MSCGHEKGRGAHGQVCVPPCVRAVCVCTCVLCVLCGISKSRMTLLVCYAPLFPRNLGPFECANYSLSTSPGARLGRAPLPLAAGRPALGGTHSAPHSQHGPVSASSHPRPGSEPRGASRAWNASLPHASQRPRRFLRTAGVSTPADVPLPESHASPLSSTFHLLLRRRNVLPSDVSLSPSSTASSSRTVLCLSLCFPGGPGSISTHAPQCEAGGPQHGRLTMPQSWVTVMLPGACVCSLHSQVFPEEEPG